VPRTFILVCVIAVAGAGAALAERALGLEDNDKGDALVACLRAAGGDLMGATVHEFTNGFARLSGSGDDGQPWLCEAVYNDGRWAVTVRSPTAPG
jgi:hypothetical protein